MIAIKKLAESILFFLGYVKLEEIIRIHQFPKSVINNLIECNKVKLFIFKKKSRFIKLKTFKKIKKSISKKDYIFNISINDLKFKMNFDGYPINGAISERIDGVREVQTTAILYSLLQPGNNVLEIGSCYGYFTNIISDIIKDTGKLIAIEGTPNNYKILKKNIVINKIKNTKTYNYFVDNNFANNSIFFNANDINPYNAKNYDHKTLLHEDLINKIKVEKILLSDFLNKINFFPEFIFMDIEGYELHVLEDLFNNTINYRPKYILFEIHNQFYPKEKPLDYLLDIISKNDYSYSKIDDKILCKLS
tara:strand:+ start:5039 stop:5956 length:918 start_codon:yes stop_codon:yes gene_type:complete